MDRRDRQFGPDPDLSRTMRATLVASRGISSAHALPNATSLNQSLRGRPVAVTALESAAGAVMAASREANAGVRTATRRSLPGAAAGSGSVQGIAGNARRYRSRGLRGTILNVIGSPGLLHLEPAAH